MTFLSCVLCWKCQLTCRFFRFVVNIEEMRYSLPGHHCRSSQTLPCTTDPKCPAPSRHRIRVWLLSHPDLRRISAACCGYSHHPYQSDNHIPHNPLSYLPGPLPLAGDPVSGKLRLRRRIDRVPDAIPDLLRAGGSRSDPEVISEIRIGYHFFHNKFCHGGTTDVAVADEKNRHRRFSYFYHSFGSPCFAPERPVLQGGLGLL